MRQRLTATIGWVSAQLSLVSLPALACPNCYSSSSPRVLLMYYLSTVALTLMPFAIVGAIVGLSWFLKRQLREDAERPVPAGTNP